MTTRIHHQFGHHIVITDEEQNMIVHALAFFHANFDLNRDCSLSCLHSEWRDVALDMSLPAVDALATKIATSN